MQENLRRLRERSATPTIKYPPASFHGPFFKLEEVGQMPSRSQSVAPLLPVSEQMSATEEYYRQQEFDYEQRQRDQYRHQQHS
uniref:Uncharacterized protein n=1 Tax=Plectus sambesii TaxID=2011161 RepID=A0A914VK73_9BILA